MTGPGEVSEVHSEHSEDGAMLEGMGERSDMMMRFQQAPLDQSKNLN